MQPTCRPTALRHTDLAKALHFAGVRAHRVRLVLVTAQRGAAQQVAQGDTSVPP